MRGLRVLLAAVVVLSGLWVADWIAIRERAGPCNPDDLTGCDTFGYILLVGSWVLPAITVVVACVLLVQIAVLLIERWRSR